MTRLSREELAAITGRTLGHYASNADGFWAGTRDHDVSQNLDALVAALPAHPRPCVLDFGCGPGRDLRALADRGCEAVGLEGCAEFARMAREHAACEVLEQDFLSLDLPPGRFHGVFANASLFHVPRQELDRVLRELREALVPGGVLFSSNPLVRRGEGRGEEGWMGERYGVWHVEGDWLASVRAAGFALVEKYYRPQGVPREQQGWLATVWRREEDTA